MAILPVMPTPSPSSPASPKQIALLKRIGVDGSKFTRLQAAEVIKAVLARTQSE